MQRHTNAITCIKQRELESACKKNGLALTVQRRAILETLLSRCDHPTADQVYEAVSARMKGVSRTTVYRVLDTFVAIGIAKKVSSAQSKARFDADTDRHHHMTCQRCGLLLDLRDSALNDIPLPTTAERKFRVMDYSITFTGLCASCNETETTSRHEPLSCFTGSTLICNSLNYDKEDV